MTLNAEVLLYVAVVSGKPVIAVHNCFEDKTYYYLVDEFKPKNPSNHVHENTLTGRNISGILISMVGFSHGISTATDTAMLTKIDELPVIKVSFNDFRWIKFQP